MTEDTRYRPVMIGRVIGIYDGRFLCWAIADRQQANRIADGRKFDDYPAAKAAADAMNAVTVQP